MMREAQRSSLVFPESGLDSQLRVQDSMEKRKEITLDPGEKAV